MDEGSEPGSVLPQTGRATPEPTLPGLAYAGTAGSGEQLSAELILDMEICTRKHLSSASSKAGVYLFVFLFKKILNPACAPWLAHADSWRLPTRSQHRRFLTRCIKAVYLGTTCVPKALYKSKFC